MMKLLFVCKHNRFRSKMTEALFKHYNKNKDIEVRSAGEIINSQKPWMSKYAVELLKQRKIPYDNSSKKVDDSLLNWADKIIIVADDVLPSSFPAEKTDVWQIPDAREEDFMAVVRIVNMIEPEVQNLVTRLAGKHK